MENQQNNLGPVPQPVQSAPAPPALTQVVHTELTPAPAASRAIPADLQQKCEESRRRYPKLNLSEGEYVISAVRRHPIGILKIWAFVFVMIATFAAIAWSTGATVGSDQGISSNIMAYVYVGVVCLSGIFALAGVVLTSIYRSNKFFLTNESVIQEIRPALFTRNEQTVSLLNIEDASFRQSGVIQTMLNYGDIRLSTEGDETTYRFNYVSNPKHQIALLNNAIEAFKNGRPVDL